MKSDVPNKILGVGTELICAATGLWNPWVGFLCGLLAPYYVNLEILCSGPPDPIPNIDPGQWLLDGTWQLHNPDVIDWYHKVWWNASWATFCECNATTAPGPCPPVAQFGGPTTTQQFSAFTFLGRQPVGHDWLTMTGIARTTTGTQAGATSAYVLLEDAAQAQIYTQNVFTMSAGGSQAMLWSSTSINATIRANVRYVSFWGKCTTASTDTRTVTLEITGYTGPCTQTTTTIPPPPTPAPLPTVPTWQPPDNSPASCSNDKLCELLYGLGQRLDSIDQVVAAIERYGVPSGYLLGVSRTAVGGATQFSISGLVGIAVDITSAPPARQLEGNPPYYWSQGWLAISDAAGMVDEKRLTRDTQVWLPPRMREATQVRIWLAEGVTATVRELLPLRV